MSSMMTPLAFAFLTFSEFNTVMGALVLVLNLTWLILLLLNLNKPSHPKLNKLLLGSTILAVLQLLLELAFDHKNIRRIAVQMTSVLFLLLSLLLNRWKRAQPSE